MSTTPRTLPVRASLRHLRLEAKGAPIPEGDEPTGDAALDAALARRRAGQRE